MGLALGTLGGGGSTLAVPLLVFGAGLSAYEATTASLLVVGLSAAAGAVGHHRRGNVDLNVGVAFALTGIVGNIAGNQISSNLSESWLLGLFSVLIVSVAWRMLRGSKQPVVGAHQQPQSRLHIVALATAVGLLTGVFGVGGGFLIVPALILGNRYEMHRAVGTSLVVVAINSAIALAQRIGQVDLDWALVLPFLCFVLGGTVAGGRLSGDLDSGRLRTGFAYLLVGIAGLTAARSLGIA